MSEKHTPGPWDAVVHSWSRIGIYSKGRVGIAELDISGDATEETQEVWERAMDANARLIAAAPEMADALRAILFQLTQGDKVFDRDDCITQARAAYTKATGGAQ